MTTREVSAKLGGLSQGRVSQLVKEGLLVVDRDPEGRLQYDRDAVEKLASMRAIRGARSAGEADERKALQAEANDRFRRQRERAREAEAARQKHLDELKERSVVALERIAERLKA